MPNTGGTGSEAEPGLAILCSAHSKASRRPSMLSVPATTTAREAGADTACATGAGHGR